MNEQAVLANQLKQEIASLEFMASGPVGTVEVKQVESYVQCLQAFFDRDVLGGREYLRKLLKGRGIHLKVNARGIYMAKSELFPMVLLTEPPPPVSPEGAVSSQCCGGLDRHISRIEARGTVAVSWRCALARRRPRTAFPSTPPT